MGKLDANRMQNATRLNKVDDAHVEMEGDLEEIFAIPDNTEIDPPIFEAVDSEGKIRGVTRLYQAAASSTPANCIGFQFEDDATTKRLILVDSVLKLYEWDDPNWVLVTNLENPGSGKIVDLTDVDFDATDMLASPGYLVAVNVGGDAFELVEGANGDGINTFSELLDCFDITTKDPDDFVVINATADGLTTVAVPDGLGAPYVGWLYSPALGAKTAQWGEQGPPEGGGAAESWYPAYQWYNVEGVPGGHLATVALTPHADGRANFYMALDAGVYDISFWYDTDAPNPYGVREWRVRSSIADNANGPATFGASNRAAVYWNPNGDLTPNANIHFLGTRTLYLTQDDTIWIEVHQDSGFAIRKCAFSLSIAQVK